MISSYLNRPPLPLGVALPRMLEQIEAELAGRTEAAGNPISDLDARDALADRYHFTSAIGKRHNAELGRTATAAFEDHQVAVV
jgi:hypothetical protein